MHINVFKIIFQHINYFILLKLQFHSQFDWLAKINWYVNRFLYSIFSSNKFLLFFLKLISVFSRFVIMIDSDRLLLIAKAIFLPVWTADFFFSRMIKCFLTSYDICILNDVHRIWMIYISCTELSIETVSINSM
jgi:hypothetical protein